VASREYGKVAPQFWTGKTGRQLRAHGRDAQLLALYLATNRHANMIGLYYLPLPLMAHEVGFTPDETEAALQVLVDVGYCVLDHERELVWVREMARYQIEETLKPGDKRVISIRSQVEEFRASPLAAAFHARYEVAFNLYPIDQSAKGDSKGLLGEREAPPKPETRDQRAETSEQGAETRDQTTPDAEVIRGAVSSSEPVGRFMMAAEEFHQAWVTALPGSALPWCDIKPPGRRTVAKFVRDVGSLDAAEAFLARVVASDYLAGRLDLPPIPMFDAFAKYDRIMGGSFDNRQSPRKIAPALAAQVVEAERTKALILARVGGAS
jgi:hypothetical protein